MTECVGGSMELEESELNRKYESFCDPRLNYGIILRFGVDCRTKYGCGICYCGKTS